MNEKEIFRKKIRRIEIRSRRAAEELFAGEYHSVFKGQGLEFYEVREYQPGDDIRSVDWNVTARLGSLFVKRYIEERERTIVLAVDVSGSGAFGSLLDASKNEISAEVAALLSFAAIKNNDKVGLLMFTDRIEKYIPPRRTREDVLRIIREILSFKPRGREEKTTNLATPLKYLSRVLKKKSILFLISDFIIDPSDVDYEKILMALARKHDVISVWIKDRFEKNLPAEAFNGLFFINDPETLKAAVVDLADVKVRQEYNSAAAEDYLRKKNFFAKAGIDSVELSTDEKSIIKSLNLFFKTREKKFGYH